MNANMSRKSRHQWIAPVCSDGTYAKSKSFIDIHLQFQIFHDNLYQMHDNFQ